MLGPEDILVERAPPAVAQQPEKRQADPPVNLLSHNRTPDTVGPTSFVSCHPAELHFRGFEPGQPLQQTVTLRNDSARQTRVIVVPPIASSCFQVVEQLGGGSLAPGLCQQLVVRFNSQQLQHYQDSILVHTEDGALSIPLHAYPCCGSPRVPKHLDLGDVPLGESATRQLQLTCNTGVGFDFSITVLQHNKHFTVAPLSGTVPAHGSTAVAVTFTPTKYSTEHLQLQVLLSEFGAEPMQMLVTGSCRPGLTQHKVQAAAAAAGGPCSDGAPHGSRQQAQDQGSRSPTASSRSPKRRAAGSPSSVCEALGKAQHITQHDVNMLLNQRPGKLQIKDIKAAIVARKQELALEQQQLQAALDAGAASGIDPLDQPSIQPDIKEALFQLQLSQAEASARHSSGLVGGKDGAHVGSTPPTPDELARMTAARAAVLEELEANKQQAAVHRLQLELKSSGAVRVLPDPGSMQPSAAGTSASGSYPGLDAFEPQWLLLSEGNDWRKRVQVAQRFVHAARVVIVRNRAQARLRKLRALALRLRSRGRDALAAGVLQDLVVEGSVVQRPGLAPASLMAPGRVRASELPQFCPQAYVQHTAVDKGLDAEFSALQPQQYKAEFEYSLLGYKAEEPPSLLPYVPLCTDQPLLPGAAEDLPGGMQVGLLPPCVASLAGMDEMPEGVLGNPYPTRSHSSTLQFAALPAAWGLDPQRMLQPRAFEPMDSAAEPPGLGAVRALAAAAVSGASGVSKRS